MESGHEDELRTQDSFHILSMVSISPARRKVTERSTGIIIIGYIGIIAMQNIALLMCLCFYGQALP